MELDFAGLIDLLESQEDPLLAWGVVDGGYSDAELEDAVDSFLIENAPLLDVREVISELKRRGLLHRDDATGSTKWRTRSAEGLRLLARLRQVFPRGDDEIPPWQSSPTLVADFRYQRSPRAYPRRDLSSREVIASMDELDPLQREALTRLTSDNGHEISLSGFQARSLAKILGDAASDESRGTVVSAGTGSGKTLAFYLPAFGHLIGVHGREAWTRAVAIYPRNELLRDQLGDAFRQARRLRDIAGQLGRPIRIGALFGDTPFDARYLDGKYGRWPRTPAGFVCPYLTCPGTDEPCGGALVWRKDDWSSGDERLVCGECGLEIGPEEFPLTRETMFDSPPDVLFSTTEMLNRSLSDARAGVVFGVGARRQPRMVLLDEIHTYGGTTGAQTAMVLRRWRHRIRRPVTFVGLSATLLDAERFFSELTGLPQDRVSEIRPEMNELEYEGAKHLVAVRSDPTSGASVLSTTIQTSMLLGRLLDPRTQSPSDGLYGTRMFVFTDDLDVTNRLYYDLLDAEGQRLDSRANPVGYKPPLAALRNPALGGSVSRRAAGQSWDLVETIGHPLGSESRLSIGRTSSQDVGVDEDAQVIVATASLEVGFDDPEVGAILQHKAPRDVAQFLQRQGRAGRPRGMRPWTVIVLSDYGRDREAYDAWDTLFDPVLPPRSLPIKNRHVLRMHATQCVLDWLAQELSGEFPRVSAWRDLSGPPREDHWGDKRRALQARATEVLQRLLAEPGLQSQVSRFMADALGLSRSEVSEILWYPPRAVLLNAVPTLLRRLRTTWAVASPDSLRTGEDLQGGTPLPDFFPSNLFTELALPEVRIRVPSQVRNQEGEREVHEMPISQALREFAPGRVSRRFATRNVYHRHWVPVPLSGQAVVDVSSSFPQRAYEGEIELVADGDIRFFPLVRPHSLDVDLVPDQIRDSSNAFLNWQTQVVERGPGRQVEVPTGEPFSQILTEMTFHLHADQSHVEMRRAARGSRTSLRMDDGTERRLDVRYRDEEDNDVAVGAVFDVDALRIDVSLPMPLSITPELERGLKSAWFRHRIVEDAELGEEANRFQLGWLHDALVVSLVREAHRNRTNLAEAFEAIRGDLVDTMEDALEILFQRVGLIVEEEDVASGPARLRGQLTALLAEGDFARRFEELAPSLWEADPPGRDEWLRRRLLVTVGHAVLAAARLLCPEHDPEGLLLDIEPGVRSGESRSGEVWISESAVGGGGFLEALVVAASRQPSRFLRLARKSLRVSDHEVVDRELRKYLGTVRQDTGLANAVSHYRSAPDQTNRVGALQDLRDALSDAGVVANHAVVSALTNRLLRPGSTAATDQVVEGVVERWIEEEERLGVEIDMRTWAYLASEDSGLSEGLVVAGEGDLQQRRLEALRSVLWPRGWKIRATGLQSWNPYAELPASTADLLRQNLEDPTPAIDVDADDVEEKLRRQLAEGGRVRLCAGSPGDRQVLANLVVALVTRPIELEFLQLHPRVAEVEQSSDGSTEVHFELLEVAGQ